MRTPDVKFYPGDLVMHEMHGVGKIVEEWGVWRSCRNCYKPCVGDECDKCGDWTYQVGGAGIYDVIFDVDGKTRSINVLWLVAVPVEQCEVVIVEVEETSRSDVATGEAVAA